MYLHLPRSSVTDCCLAECLPKYVLPFERIHALTNFFNLSNIHPVLRRSGVMVRTSQCFRVEFYQLDGPPTLAAAELFPYPLVPPAFIIKPDGEDYALDFSSRHKSDFLSLSFPFSRRKAYQFICVALRSQLFRKHCASPLRRLQAVGSCCLTQGFCRSSGHTPQGGSQRRCR